MIPPAKEEECVPYQRYGHTCVGYHNSAYIWGGRNDKDGACNILYAFDSGKGNLRLFHWIQMFGKLIKVNYELLLLVQGL